MKKKKLILGLALIVVLLVGMLGGTALAITMFSEKLAGLGSSAFTNEVEIIKIKIKSTSEVRVRLSPTVNAVAARVYTVKLYGDNEQIGTNTVSWTAPEIVASTDKDVDFTGLSLAGVTLVDADVVY